MLIVFSKIFNNIKRYQLFLAWIIIYSIGIIFAFLNFNSEFFKICVQTYFFGFASINLGYSINKKIKSPEIARSSFINEILVGFIYIILGIIYPYLFPNITNPIIRQQIYFHTWDSLTVHLLCWQIYTYIACRNNHKKHRDYTYDEWNEIFLNISKNHEDLSSDFQRKLIHFIAPMAYFLFLFLSHQINSILGTFGWDPMTFATFGFFIGSIHFAWIVNIADLLRLTHFKQLGRFATRWFEKSLRPTELNTFASGTIMVLSWLPFLLAPLSIFLSVATIGALSDAMASTIGKKFGKKKLSSGKTIIGFIAGFITTFLIVNLVQFVLPLPNISHLDVQIIAFTTALGFVVVDYFANIFSDNCLNPLITGSIIWILWISLG
ncbi:MAG: hypothetical protein ACTSVU_00085 [Promethearchaeota archaeon]